MAKEAESSAADKLQRMLTGSWVAQSIYVAAKLQIAELLRDGPKTVAQLANATNTHEGALYRLLRTLVSLGIFERRDRTFSLNALGETLLPGVPHSKWALAVMFGEEHFKAWSELLYSVRTGKPAFDHLYGEGIFEYLSKNPDQAKIFDAAMTAVHGRESTAMIEAYDFAQFKTVADVGGGNGGLLIALLTRYPGLNGILFDLPHVAQRAKPRLAKAGLEQRCQVIEGSFFESVPSGADAYLMRHIIHDWDDERSIRILQNCRNSLQSDGRVLILESVIPENDEPGFGKLLDLNMLVMPGGLERTETEYQQLLAKASLRLTRIVPTAAEVHVIESVAI